jgi:beta-lactam-binding protein with PASTA domain
VTAHYPNTVSVLINSPGLCTVQNVQGKTLSVAQRTIARANCRLGKIRRAYSRFVKKRRVISQKPKPGTVLPEGGAVGLVLSRGRKR